MTIAVELTTGYTDPAAWIDVIDLVDVSAPITVIGGRFTVSYAYCNDCGAGSREECTCGAYGPQDVSWLDVCQDDCVCLCCSDGGPVWAHDVTPLADPRTWQDDVVELAPFNYSEEL